MASERLGALLKGRSTSTAKPDILDRDSSSKQSALKQFFSVGRYSRGIGYICPVSYDL